MSGGSAKSKARRIWTSRAHNTRQPTFSWGVLFPFLYLSLCTNLINPYYCDERAWHPLDLDLKHVTTWYIQLLCPSCLGRTPCQRQQPRRCSNTTAKVDKSSPKPQLQQSRFLSSNGSIRVKEATKESRSFALRVSEQTRLYEWRWDPWCWIVTAYTRRIWKMFHGSRLERWSGRSYQSSKLQFKHSATFLLTST